MECAAERVPVVTDSRNLRQTVEDEFGYYKMVIRRVVPKVDSWAAADSIVGES